MRLFRKAHSWAYLLRSLEWPCDFCAGLIIQSQCRDHFKVEGWLTKCQTGQNTWQTNQIEPKGSPISQNISKMLIILSHAWRTPPRGAAGRSKFHLKENGHTQEMAPEVQPLSAIRPSSREAPAAFDVGLATFVGSISAGSCFSLESQVLHLKINSSCSSPLSKQGGYEELMEKWK